MKKDNKIKTEKNSYLTFRLAEELFAVHVNNVLNILETPEITKVPKSPDYIKGVINLRGQVLPVIDTRLKMGMPPFEATANTSVIVMEIPLNDENLYVGSLADKAEAVQKIDSTEIKPAPEISKGINNEFLNGIAEVDNEFVMILDAEKILLQKQAMDLSETVNNK